MTHTNVGILGIGTYLPPEVRTNDWWPKEVVAGWIEKANRSRSHREQGPPPKTRGERLVAEAVLETLEDPFRGSIERRVMPEGMTSAEMEIEAAKDAAMRADVSPSDIDLVLTHTTVPDYLSTNCAATVHQALGLPSRCFSLSVEAACNSFHHQLSLAQEMIRGQRARFALLIQSCAISRLLPYEEFYSPWFGDGATAVVVGPVSENRGLIGQAHFTDGRFQNALVSGVPGGRWYESGPVVLYPEESGIGQRMFLSSADTMKEAIDAALVDAAVDKAEVDYFGCHQATAWFRKASQECADLSHCRSLDTFPWAASLFAANVPLVLSTAEQEGQLRDGDIVVTGAAGNGITCSSTVLRWGTG